jgi:hypothetical protein
MAVAPLITAVYPVVNWIEAFQRAREKGTLKVLLSPSIHRFDDEPIHSGLSAE